MALIAIGGPCPNCGGPLEGKGRGKFVCPYCDSEFFDESQNDVDDIDDEEYEPATPEEIEEIVKDAIKDCVDRDCYGVQIGLHGKRMSKEGKARANFDIPSDETVYMIYDETMFGSCKEGYALTNKGLRLFYKDTGAVYFPWDEFVDVDLDDDGGTMLYLDDYEFNLTGGGALDFTFDMLDAIQEDLDDYEDYDD